jgi:hypothetical protein
MNTAAIGIYNKFAALFTAATPINLTALGHNFGMLLSESLSAKTDTTVAYI